MEDIAAFDIGKAEIASMIMSEEVAIFYLPVNVNLLFTFRDCFKLISIQRPGQVTEVFALNARSHSGTT